MAGRGLGCWKNRFLNKVLLLGTAFGHRRICLKCPSKSDSIFLPNGVAAVRRSPKSFVVEVKRARKGVSSNVFGVSLHKNQADDVDDVVSTTGAASAVPAPPLQSPPQRRILEALVRESPARVAEPVAEPVAKAAARRPRRAAEAVEPPPSRIAKAPQARTAKAPQARTAKAPQARTAKAPAVRVKKSPEAVKPLKPGKSVKFVTIEALPAAVDVVDAPVAAIAPAQRPALTGRADEASRLPRGERWKRRLPKALW
jgi:hypothetical protein